MLPQNVEGLCVLQDGHLKVGDALRLSVISQNTKCWVLWITSKTVFSGKRERKLPKKVDSPPILIVNA